MSGSLFHRLLNALSFANVGTLSEFHRVLDRQIPVAATPVWVAADNVLPFRRKEAAFACATAALPQTRLKP